MAGIKQSVCAGRQEKSSVSINKNRDRVLAMEFFRKKGAQYIVTPPVILELFNILEDTRLVAFILGVDEKSVVSAVNGNVFPEGMAFTTRYVSEVLGVSISMVRDRWVRIGKSGKGLEGKAVISANDATILAQELRIHFSDELIGATEAMKITGFSWTRLISIVEAFYGKNTDRPRKRKLFNRAIIEKIRDSFVVIHNEDAVKMANEAFAGKGNTIMDGKILCSININGSRLLMVRSDIESIIKSVSPKGVSWKGFTRRINKELKKRNSELVEEIEQLIGK